MDDKSKKEILDDILDRVGAGGIGNIILEQNNTINVGKEQPTQMPPYLRHEEAIDLYRFLIEGNYIDAKTKSDDFLYIMGVSPTAPVRLSPVNWLTTVQQLRTMLKLVFADPLKKQSLKLAEIERRAPSCFLNKGKRMQQLAKDKEENSLELDELENYFRPK